MKADIKLGPDEVKRIIREHIERTLKQKVSNVRFDITAGYHDRYESSSPSLQEVVVSIDINQPAEHGKPENLDISVW